MNLNREVHSLLFIRIHKNIEAQIWSELFSKTMKNSESLDQEKHFKHVFGQGSGENLRKYGSKLRTCKPRPTFTGSYKKKSVENE